MQLHPSLISENNYLAREYQVLYHMHLKKIRELDANARIIMISAVNQKDKLAESIQAGASDFIVKPFDKNRLKVLLEKILGE